MKRMKSIFVLLLMVLLVTACENKEESDVVKVEDSEVVEETTGNTVEKSENEEPVNLFGTFTSYTLEGEEVTEDIFTQADLTMVNIWGTFCGPCIAEMPDLGDISREYKDKGVQIVGLLCDVMEPGNETALEIVGETKADYIHMIASEDLITNVLQYVSSVPTTAFVDKDGNIVGEIYAGSRSKTEWQLIINQYLAEVK